MNKALFASLILCIISFGLIGQTEVHMVSENAQELVVSFHPGEVQFKTEQTPWGEMLIPIIDQGTFLLKEFYPELQKLTTSFIIPDQGSSELEIISSSYYEIQNIDICPSKGNLLRTVNPDDVQYSKGDNYYRNEFWPGNIASLQEPYILRDFRGQTIVVTPFAYNPVLKTLRVYTEITVKVTFNQKEGLNEFVGNKQMKPINSDFSAIYSRQFINYSGTDRYTPVEEDGKMLIICYGSFMTEMEPFVRWKNQKGIPTEIVDVSTIGNAAQIKTYVANYYNTNGLTYLLLVGDNAQVQASSTSAGPSDNNYAYIVGSDHYPDIFVGRFSAENVEHVNTQVTRSVQYEKYPQVSGTWYTKGIGIGSEQGPGHNNLYDHEHIRVLNTKLLAFTYVNMTEHFDGTQGGLDLPGNPTATQVHNDLNPGAGIIVYCGHGSDQSWGTSGYSNTQVNQLTNINKLPFIFSVACVNGNFTATTCFAEAWLRAESEDQPTGAIATLMSTINQSWNPPMCGELEMVDILTESHTGNIKRSFGGISMNGCMEMNDQYASAGEEMTDTWTVFGDPSIVVRTDAPGPMTVTHPAQTIIGNDNIDVQCNINDALVCLSIDGVILGRGYVSGGTVNIMFSPLTTVDPIDVVVTAFNKQTYLGQILVIPPAGPYVIKETIVVNDASANNNGLADFGENFGLNVTLKNIGIDPANNVTATLSTSNTYVTITDNSAGFGNIAAGSSGTVNNAFLLTVDADIPDQETVVFTIATTNGTDIWNSTYSLVLNAPVLAVTGYTIQDPTGNNNGRLDPGETVNMIFNTSNTGHATSPIANGSLTSSSSWVTITDPSSSIGSITNGAFAPATFEVIIDPSTPIGTSIEFTFTCTATPYSAAKTVNIPAGLILEDWEANNFTQYPWNMTNVGNAPWQIITGGNVFEGDFAARSGVISDDQQSILSITLNVLTDDTISFYKKVSCEKGSDYGTWWDYLVFHINTTEKGKWDGEIDWSREAYFVAAGSRTFKWTYIKDNMVSEGEDAAWIDFVIFPPHQTSAGTSESPSVSHYITAWPNPATDMMVINIGLISDESLNISIIDINGNTVKVVSQNQFFTAGNYQQTVSVDDLSAGNYFIRLSSSTTLLMHPVIIVK